MAGPVPRRSPLTRPLPPGRRAWFAFSLSLLCPGWGQLYAGDLARAAAAALLVLGILVPGVVSLWILWADGPRSTLAAGAATLAALLAVPADAVWTARRIPARRHRAWQTLGLQVLFVPVVVLGLRAEFDWIRASGVQVFAIPTDSMAPTLLPGDLFLVDARPAARANLRAGDVVVFEAIDEPGIAYAKRLIGLAGSEVAVRDGRLEVDGWILTQPGDWPHHGRETLGDTTYRVLLGAPGEVEDFGPLSIPPGHLFVLGDSRARSRDSRSFGPIPLERVRGRALRILWSWDTRRGVRWGRLGRSVGRLW